MVSPEIGARGVGPKWNFSEFGFDISDFVAAAGRTVASHPSPIRSMAGCIAPREGWNP
jgi:hypothetical protein